MLKETITYTDYNGVNRTEDFYFNLSKSEIMEMELGTTGGFAEMIQKVISAKDSTMIIKIFKDLVLKSYGEKSADGKRFMKSDEISAAFSQTEAYDQIFMKLATDTDAAIMFVNGIMPSDLQKDPHELKAMIQSGNVVELNRTE